MLKGLREIFFRGGPRHVQHTPEGEELAKKQSELSNARADLVEGELALATLLAELAAFEGMYLRTVGVLYAELDELHAQAAERAAQIIGMSSAKYQADRAKERAAKSRARVNSPAAHAPGFHPTPELLRLYRKVVGLVHPDLTTDLSNRAEREQLMADANRAFESCNEDELGRLLQGHDGGPESVQGEGGSDLGDMTRQVIQIQQRLSEIEAERNQITLSSIARRWTQAKEAKTEGRDLLSELAANLQPRIRAARNR